MASILIAEDDQLIASLLEKGLTAQGYVTVLVDDGEQARSLSLTEGFDLIILDMGLPEFDGFQVLEALRSRPDRPPVLVVTGQKHIHAAACLEAGADDYISKPFHFKDLLSHVRALLQEGTEAPAV